jgi:hypothetical protein
VTLPTDPQPGAEGRYSVEPTPVSPVSMSLPLAPFVVEKRRGSSALSLLLGVALVVAVGGVAFAAGRLTAPASATAAAGGGRGGTGFGGTGLGPGASGAPGGGGFGGAGGLGGATAVTVQGTVQTISPTSISVTLPNGTTIQIPLDASTTYHGRSAATAAEVKPGVQVLVEVSGGFGGRGGGQGGPNPSAGAPVSGPGAASPAASPAAGASGPTAGGAGVRGALGPARDITIVAP